MSSEVQIKGTRHGLMILIPHTGDFDELKDTLRRKMESANGFFRGAHFFLRPEQASLPAHQQEELELMLVGYGLVPLPSTTPPRPPSRPKPAALPAGDRTHIIWRTIRSGQRARNDLGHLVIMGDVHSGALVEAGGHVLIMGSSWGTVRAGIYGDRQAKVTGLDFRGGVVSIADAVVLIGESEATPQPGPHQALLNDKGIVFVPFPAK
ncbi:MAG: septum site-determining protein MinC [Bacillota bacterium]